MPDVAAHWQHTSAETAPFDYTWRSGLMSRLGLDVGAMPAGGRFAPDAPPASYMGPGAWGRGHGAGGWFIGLIGSRHVRGIVLCCQGWVP